jgi:hypothetical protein
MANQERHSQHRNFQQTIAHNKQNKILLISVFTTIASALTSNIFVMNLSIEKTSVLFDGVAQTERELLFFVTRLKKSLFFKTMHLQQLKKKPDDRNITFELIATLRKSLL